MAYGRNPRIIKKVEPVLKLLLSSDSEITVPTKDPTKLAYYLYNAIWLSTELEQEPYNQLDGKWKFTAKVKEGKVVCKPKHEVLELNSDISFECEDDSMAVVTKVIAHPSASHITIYGISLLTYQEVKGWADVNNIDVIYNQSERKIKLTRM